MEMTGEKNRTDNELESRNMKNKQKKVPRDIANREPRKSLKLSQENQNVNWSKGV